MISRTFVALSAFVLSVNAYSQIQSTNTAFFNAGIQGCISTSENADGAEVVIHDCNTEDIVNHEWQVSFYTREEAGPQNIVAYGDKCLDVKDGKNADGTKLQLWTCSNGPNQKWVSKKDNTFQWVGTNKCIDLSGGSIGDGNQLQIWTCDSKNVNQSWRGAQNPSDRDVTQITPTTTGLGPFCLAAESDTDGAKVAIVGCTSETGTHFYPKGNVTWTVPTAPLTGQIKIFQNKCLDVPAGSHQNGVKLQIWTCGEGNGNQLFQDHIGQIEWKGTGKCLDLTDGVTTNGSPVQLWDCGANDIVSNPNQWWFLADLTIL